MPESPPTRRRWLQFSLRTLFVLMTVVAIFLVWERRAINERRSYLAEHPEADVPPMTTDVIASAPFALRLLGEKGQTRLRVNVTGFLENRTRYKLEAPQEAQYARQLFPEAIIEVVGGGTLWDTWEPSCRTATGRVWSCGGR